MEQEAIMGFLDALRRALSGRGGQSSGGGRSSFGDDPNTYWIYAQCRRCGEPLKARINLMNDLSETEDGEGWVVRKGLVGTGANRCFQVVEVTLTFDRRKEHVIASDVVGGKLLTVQEYEELTH